MKKLLAFLLQFFLVSSLVLSEDVKQIIVPLEFYVGDSVQLRYSFDSSVDFFAIADPTSVKNDTLSLSPLQPAFVSPEMEYSVKEVSLQRYGSTYTIAISFVPWIAGTINFPPFDLYDYCKDASAVQEGASSSFVINLEPVTVRSVLENTGDIGLREPVAPLLVPGSVIFIWLFFIILFVFLVLLTWILIRFHYVIANLLAIKDKIGFRINYWKACKLLKKSKKLRGRIFAIEWQSIMRDYLSYRFHTPFDSIATANIFSTISDTSGGMLDLSVEDAVINLVSLFRRTDYIIFAHDSLDSKQMPRKDFRAEFSNEEYDSLIEKSVNTLRAMEVHDGGHND